MSERFTISSGAPGWWVWMWRARLPVSEVQGMVILLFIAHYFITLGLCGGYFSMSVFHMAFNVTQKGNFGQGKWSHQRTCQVLFSQWMDFPSAEPECVCTSRQYRHEAHTCISHTSMCFTPCSQTTRIIQISAQHSAAIIQIANTEEKGGFWTKPQLLQLTKPRCPDLSYLLPCLCHSRLSKKHLKSKKREGKRESFNVSLVFLCCH